MRYIVFSLLLTINAYALIIIPPPVPVVTKDAAKRAAVRAIRFGVNDSFKRLKSNLNSEFELIWLNRSVTPPETPLIAQDVYTALGVDQCEAHKKFLEWSRIVNTVEPGAVPDETLPVQESGDGDQCIVTVGEPGKPGK